MARNAKIDILLNSARTTLRTIADFLYVLAFGAVTMHEFLYTVQLLEEQLADWREIDQGKADWIVILLVIVLFQYLCSEEFDWKEYLLAAAVCVLVLRMRESGDVSLALYLLMIIGARKMSFRKLMWLYFGVTLFMTVFTVIGAYTGWVENLVFDAREGRMALGFVYATDGAAHFIFLALAYWCVRGRKMRFWETGIFGVFAYVTWTYCKARFSSALLISLVIVALIYCIVEKRLGSEKWDQIMGGWPSALFVIFPLLANLAIHVMSFCYTDELPWMVSFNKLLSNRLSLAKTGLEVYGLELWGNSIPMRGNGGRTTMISDYYYIDSSFLQISMLQGVVILAVLMLIFTMACLRARRAKAWIPLTVLVFVAIHGLFEHHAFQLAYNSFLLMAFAELQPGKKVKRSRIWKARKTE